MDVVRRILLTIASILTIGGLGCKSPQPCSDQNHVFRQLLQRTAKDIERIPPGQQRLPPNVVLEDGLSEDEALLAALSNNSAFQATLSSLGAAQGDALQASLLANPQFLTYFPSGIKEGQFTLFAPIESYLLRPARVKVANREYRRIGEQLVQNGLNLSRDVRIAYTDWTLAQNQADLALEAQEIRNQIKKLTDDRLKDGDISELESIAAKVDALNAQANLGVQRLSIEIAQARLATLIGLPDFEDSLVSNELPEPTLPVQTQEDLIQEALACRPDLNAAKWAVAAARERSGLSRWLWLRLDAVYDVRELHGRNPNGAGLRFDLPIFNRNQGGVMRADWELNAALHNQDAISDQIIADVKTAYRQLLQAQQNYLILQKEIQPALADALQIAQKGYQDGGSDYLIVLQTTTQYITTKGQILVQKAACNRALAELERSVGRSLMAPPLSIDEVLQATAPDSPVAD